MPCRTDGPFSQDELPPDERWKGEIRELACTYCGILEDKNIPVPEWARPWWEDHKRRDEIRMERDAEYAREQAIKKAALDKLTLEEREALGL